MYVCIYVCFDYLHLCLRHSTSVAITYTLIHERFLAVCFKTPANPSKLQPPLVHSLMHMHIIYKYVCMYMCMLLHFQCFTRFSTPRVAFASHLLCCCFIFMHIFYFSYSQFAYFVLHSSLFSPASATFHWCTYVSVFCACIGHLALDICFSQHATVC